MRGSSADPYEFQAVDFFGFPVPARVTSPLSKIGPFALEAQGQPKSVRTRARLMDAAVELFAEHGFEAASVNEIARVADVVNGTFYTHFKDKEEIAAEVAYRISVDLSRHLDRAMEGIDDAVERFVYATRQYIELAHQQPHWGLVLVRSAWYLPALHRRFENYLLADLNRGARQGAFDQKIDMFTVEIIASMILATLSARLRGEAGPDAGSRVAELALRTLGVRRDRAKKAAWAPIAILPIEGFTATGAADAKPAKPAALKRGRKRS